MMKEFCLLDEPWIRVLCADLSVKEISLTDALLSSHEYVRLAGETATQDAAVLRLLLAVVHTVFYRMNEAGDRKAIDSPEEALRRWKAIWDMGRFPKEPIASYLQEWKDRFYLFSDERPFFQTETALRGTFYSAAKLNGEILESGNKPRLFASYAGEEKESMSYAQAARWLLYTNGFDDTSMKPTQKGLPRGGVGWLGKLGLVIPRGETLFETLMYNLVMLRDDGSIWGEPTPYWEEPEERTAERVQIPHPDNQSQLLTMQSRRIILQREEDRVTGFYEIGGDFIDTKDAFVEQMTVWKVTKDHSFVPWRHDEKWIWKELTRILGEDDDRHRRPGVLRWIGTLVDSGCISQDSITEIWTPSVTYGSKDFFIEDANSDSLPVYAKLFSRENSMMRKRIYYTVHNVQKIAWTMNLCMRDSKRPVYLSEMYFDEIDMDFRSLVQAIQDGKIGKCNELENDFVERADEMLQKQLRLYPFRQFYDIRAQIKYGQIMERWQNEEEEDGET